MKRVVKLGGSLLGWAEWPDACREWLKRQAATNLIIVGGGTPVDAVRRLSAQLHTPAETSHWSAIRAMGATAQLAAAALTEADMVQDVSTIVAGPASTACYVLEVEHSLRSASRHAMVPELPASWDVTSDSIAAWVARIWDADQLLLLKSSPPRTRPCTIVEAAASGFVDSYFPRAAVGLRSVVWVNLRQPHESGHLQP